MNTFKNISSLVCGALLALISTQAKSLDDTQCDLNSIAHKLETQPALSSFEQVKSIQVLSTPLKSSGYLLLSESSGLVWQTTTPIKSTTVITDSELKQFNKKDQPVMLPDNANAQASQIISSTFLAILSGNFSELEQNFNTTTTCNEGRWALSLDPSNSTIIQIMQHIQIGGQNRIEQITFSEANGDKTDLQFFPESSDEIKQRLRKYLVN